MRLKCGLSYILIVIFIGLSATSAISAGEDATGSYVKYPSEEGSYWADRMKTINPMSERLSELGYLGDGDPTDVSNGSNKIPMSLFSAMNFFAQVMGIEYSDGIISVEVQDKLYSDNARKSPVLTPNHDARRLSPQSDKTESFPMYAYITLSDVQKSGNSYIMTGTFTTDNESGENVRIQYIMPDLMPEVYTGDDVVVVGHFLRYEESSHCFIINAQLVAFPSA